MLKATMWITLCHILGRVFGLIQSRVVGDAYGLGVENDAFVIAFEGVIWTLFLVGEESLGPAFLPVFMDVKDREGEVRAWRFTSSILNLQLLVLLGATALLYFFPSQAIEFLTHAGNAKDLAEQSRVAERGRLAVHFLGSMAPALIGISGGSLTYMVLNGYKEFFWPAFADAALKIALVGGVVIGHMAGLNSDALIVGALAAGFAKIAVHLFGLGRRFSMYKPTIDFNDPYVRKFLYLVAPLLVGIVFAKTRDYFNNIYVLSSLETGMLSINSFGRKIFNTISAVIPYPLSIAMFPFFCELVAKDDNKALGDFLTRSSRMLLLFFVPLAGVIFVLSDPLGRFVFETGRVSGAAASKVGLVTAFYCMVLPFTALEFIFMQAFFSKQRTFMVTAIGMFFSALTMLITYVGVFKLGYRGVDAVVVVALSYTISKALKSLALITILKFHGLPVLPLGSTMVFALRVVILGIACGGASFGTLRAVERVMPAKSAETAELKSDKTDAPDPVNPPALKKEEAASDAPQPSSEKPAPEKPGPEKKKPGFMASLATALRAAPRLVVPGLAAAFVFLIGCKLLRLVELDEMIAFAKEKMKLRKRGKLSPATAPSLASPAGTGSPQNPADKNSP